MMKYEVTIGQYLAFSKKTDGNWPEWLEKDSKYNIHTGTNVLYSSIEMSETNLNHPVTGVYWNNARAYAKWFSGQTGQTWRLPTEAEWEYAAKGGEDYKYAGSDNIDDVAWHSGNSDRKTRPVGRKKHNGYCLYDMSGNVWEWCADWYDSYYYQNSPSSNPRGSESATYEKAGIHRIPLGHVFRGGSYFSADGCQVTNRGRNSPGSGNRYYGGFRLCRTL